MRILEYFKAEHEDENCAEDAEDDAENEWVNSVLCLSCFFAHRLRQFWRTLDEKIIIKTLGTLDQDGYILKL